MSNSFMTMAQRRRAALLCGAALGLTVTLPAFGQAVGEVPVLPGGNPAVGGSVTVGGAEISLPDARSVGVNLNDRNRVVDWQSFNLADGTKITFGTADTLGNYAILNRVVGDGSSIQASRIFGQMIAQNNIAVWLSNPSGIMIGSSGSFNGGSLVLTTAAISPGDIAKFNGTAAGSLTGTVGLNAMSSAANIEVIGGITNGDRITGVIGSLIIAAQAVDVRARIDATGDVALVAARSVDVPAAVGSNVRVTITEGTTLGRLTVDSAGNVTGSNILVGGAAADATDLLLGINPGATLSADATNGRIIIAAGVSSGDSAVDPAITVAPGSGTGIARVALNGALSAGGLVRVDSRDTIGGAASGASVQGGTIAWNAGNGIDYVGALGGRDGVSAITAAGNIALAGIRAGNPDGTGTGSVSIDSAGSVTLGTLGTAQLTAAAGVSIIARNGSIASLGGYTIASGTGTGTDGITLDQRTSGAIDLTGSTIRAGTESMAGTGHRGIFNVVRTTGDVSLGTVDAGSVLLPTGGLAGSIFADRITTADTLGLTAVGDIGIDSVSSINGGVALTGSNVSGRAAGTRMGISALSNGQGVTVTATNQALLGNVTAGTIGTGATASGVDELRVTANVVDVLAASAATGNLRLEATGATGEIRGASATATLGSVTLTAAGAIRGQVDPSAVPDGIRLKLANARDLLSVDASGNARLGTLDTSGRLEALANGSITGLATADTLAGAGIAVTAGTTVTVGSTATRPTRVALGAVRAGGAVDVFGTAVSAQSINTIGGVTVNATTGQSIDAIGDAGRVASVTLRQTGAVIGGEDPAGILWSANSALSPNFTGAMLTAGGALVVNAGRAPVTTGTLGLAQIAMANGGSVSISAEAVTVGSASAITSLGLTARAGGLYLGDGSAGTTASFIKTGTAGPLDEDELRIATPFTAGGTILVESATDVRGAGLTSTAGTITVNAQRSTTGLKLATPLVDGRLAANYGRLGLNATGAATATVNVIAGGIAQLGTVAAGSGDTLDATLNQIVVTGGGIDVDTVRTVNGNLVLASGLTGLRLSVGDAAWGVSRYNPDGTYSAGLVSTGDAQVGTLTARNGDVLLRVDGVLSGLLGAGAAPGSIVDGLTLGDADGVDDLSLAGAGDVVLGTARIGRASVVGGGNIRIGSLAASRDVTVRANGSVTGLGGVAIAAAGANLVADRGSIRMPDPTGAPAGEAAILGTVRAAQAVDLRANSLSAQSIAAGTTATVAATNGLVVDRLGAATGTLTVSGGTASVDGTALTVDPATGRLRDGFGFADISTSSTTEQLSVTAVGGVAQLGLVTAGQGNALSAGLSGTTGQLIVDAQAISAQRLGANNGSLVLTARSGDMYLGTPTDASAATIDTVASAGDRMLIEKQGTAGLVTVNGAVLAGAGSYAATPVGDDGIASVTSATDIRGRRIESLVGDVRLRAVGAVGGLVSSEPLAADGMVIRQGDVGGLVTIDGGDVRIGSLVSRAGIRIDAAGSVTGLSDTIPGSAPRALDVVARRDISVAGLAGTLGSATLNLADAGRDIDVTAVRTSLADVRAGNAVNLTGTSGLFVASLAAGGTATFTAGGVLETGTPLFVIDDTTVANEALAANYGFANLRVDNAGTATSDPTAQRAGTIIVTAGNIAQLGTVRAGLDAVALTDGAGAPRDQIRVAAQAATIGNATALNGDVTLNATIGGLYVDGVASGTRATLIKRDATGAVDAGNELRLGTLIAGTTDTIGATRGAVLIDSTTAARLGTVTSRTGSIQVIGTDVTGLLRATPVDGSDGQILPAYGAANLFAAGPGLADTPLDAAEPIQRITVDAAGVAKFGIVDAGRGTTLAAAGLPQVSITARAMDVASVITRNGDLRLETTTGRLRMAEGSARNDATLIAGSTAATDAGVRVDAEIGSLIAGGNILVNASRAVTGLKWLGQAVPTVEDGLRVGLIDAGGPDADGALRTGTVVIDGIGNVRLGSVRSTGALGITARGGSVTGLAGAIVNPTPAVSLLRAGGNVTVRKIDAAGAPRLATALVDVIRAGGFVAVDADTVDVNSATAGGDVTLTAGRVLNVGSIIAATTSEGMVRISTDTTGAGDIDNAVPTTGGTAPLAAGYGGATLIARSLITGGATTFGKVGITAANAVQLDTVTAGSATIGGVLTIAGRVAPQVTIEANAIRINALDAFNGGVDLLAQNGDLTLETGTAGGQARLRKRGSAGAVYLGTLVSGTQAGSAPLIAADSTGTSLLFRGGTTFIDSATAIRGTSITSQTGDILLRAVTGVTSRQPGTGTVAGDFTIGSINADGAVDLTSGGNMRLGSVETPGAITATALASLTGLGGPAGGDGINLTAAGGVDIHGNTDAALSLAALGAVSAGGTPLLETGQPGVEAIRIEAGAISARSLDTLGGDIRLAATRSLNVGSIGQSGAIGRLFARTDTANGEFDNGAALAADAPEDPLAGRFGSYTLAQGYGDARLIAGGALRVTAGVVGSTGGVAQLGPIKGSQIGVQANALLIRGGEAKTDLVSARALGALALTSRSGALYLQSGIADGVATLTKNGSTDEQRIGSLTASAVAADSATGIRAGMIVATGRLTADSALPAEIALVAHSGGVTGLREAAATDGRIDPLYGRADLTAAAAGARISVGATTVAQLGTLTAGSGTAADRSLNQIVVRAADIDTASAIAANGNLVLEARTGKARLGTGRAGGGIEEYVGPGQAYLAGVRAGTDVEIGTATADTGDLQVTAASGSVSGLRFTPGVADATDGRLLVTHDRANLSATAANRRVIVQAGPATGVTAQNIAQLGTVVAGADGTADRTLNQIVVRAGAIDAATATARNGNLVLEARAGRARLGTGIAGGGIEEYVGEGQAYSAGVRAATDVEIGNATALTGDLQASAASGTVSGLRFTPGTAAATDGRLLVTHDRANLTASAANRRVIAQAGPATGATAQDIAQLGTVSAGRGTTRDRTLDQIVVRAGAIDLASATGQATNAINGNLVLNARAGRVRLGTTTAGGDIAIDSTTDVDLLGQVSATNTASVVTITNTGTTGTQIGSGVTGNFALTDVEMNRLTGPTIIVNSRGNALTIGTLAIGINTDAANSLARNVRLKLLGAGTIGLTGRVSGNGAGRTLQIGGSLNPLPVGGGLANATDLATSITAQLGLGAAIDWSGGTVDLAANRIVFGQANLLADLPANGSAAAAPLLVSNPNSSLYRGSGSATPYLTATTLRVAYGDYALFQNGGINSAITAGAMLGTAGTPVALRLTSVGGDNANNSFALFGSINGFIASAAALQPEPVIDFSGGAPRVVRVTLANSRVNGCVIASPGAGCLASTPPPPTLTLFDERQIQLFRTDDNAEIEFEPLIGTNNEGLIGDLSTGTSATALCPTGTEATCPKREEVKP